MVDVKRVSFPIFCLNVDASRRKRIALGTTRGLLYLHEQCDPKRIHRGIGVVELIIG